MTAEVAILNRSAIAIAADSAMTFGRPGSEKIYPAHKIFTLSKFHPVGVMIYNNADYMGVPLETIIKMYREKEWDTPQPTLIDYANKFVTFLENKKFCTASEESENIIRIFESVFVDVANNVRREIQDQFVKTGRIPKQKIGKIIKDCIEGKRSFFESLEDNPIVDEIKHKTFASSHNTEFEKAVEYAFGTLRLTIANKNALRSLARLAIIKDYPTDAHTGIVITGFGDDEMFPSLVEVLVDGVIDKHLKLKLISSVNISRDGTGTYVRAFAQKEMVNRFMDGVDPNYEDYIKIYVRRLMNRLSDEIVKTHVSGTQQEKNVIKKGISNTIDDYMNELEQFSSQMKYEEFSKDIIDMVSNMPKSEMAHMAEALVNLTSIKRRVSAEKETVGGPIDVAVISKGDGFIWIKRKHYFDINVNQDFMKRYFMGGVT